MGHSLSTLRLSTLSIFARKIIIFIAAFNNQSIKTMSLWDFIHSHLSKNEKVILLVVIEVKGSSPGRVGFKMAVAEEGDIAGSIGGGVMEYNMVELARVMLSDKSAEILVKRQVHNPESALDESGMICSGEQTQAFIPLTLSDRETIGQIKECLDKGERGIMKISSGGLDFVSGNLSEKYLSLVYNDPDNWEFTESLGLTDTFFIFGAGHVSVPLSRILRMLDFRVVVFDDRKEVSTFTLNSYAHDKQIIDYNNIDKLVPEGQNSYVAIMSNGHKSDWLIIRQLLPKKLKYLGMIGSKSKVQAIFKSLTDEGFSDKDFARVDSPIGIPINSQTPAEIAVSIAAKIIQVRSL